MNEHGNQHGGTGGRPRQTAGGAVRRILRRRWVRIALIVSAVAALVLVGAVAVLVVGLSGGPGSFLRSLQRPPDPAALGRERRTAAVEIAGALDAAAAPLGLTALAEGRHDECYQGQHNFKIQDPYAYRCALRVTRFYGLDDARGQLLRLGDTLEAAGWAPTGVFDLREEIAEHIDGPGWQGPAAPIPASFTKGGLRLEVAFQAAPPTGPSGEGPMFEFRQRVDSESGTPSYERRRLVDVVPLLAARPPGRPWVLSLSAEERYFEK